MTQHVPRVESHICVVFERVEGTVVSIPEEVQDEASTTAWATAFTAARWIRSKSALEYPLHFGLGT
jgi:hypothetical protein